MKQVHIDCELQYSANSVSDFIFNIQAANHQWQSIKQDRVSFLPSLNADYGYNHIGDNKLVRLCGVSGKFSIRYQAEIDVAYPEPIGNEAELKIPELPIQIIPYLWSSRFCESDTFYQTAVQLFGNIPAGYQRVAYITDWIKQNITYELGSSNGLTSAMQVWQMKKGVCRDFAHLGICFCRALNIPARFVAGYATDLADTTNDFHAIFEAYLGCRWILFDPTKLCNLSQFVRISTGRDASDCAFCNIYGNGVRMTYMNPSSTMVI
jgi:transglutaminase-like putative cysteine protease